MHHGPFAPAPVRPARLRSGGAPSQLHPRGRGARHDAGGGELSDQGFGGARRRAVVPAGAAAGGADANGAPLLGGLHTGSGPTRRSLPERTRQGAWRPVDHGHVHLRRILARAAPRRVPRPPSRDRGQARQFRTGLRPRARRARHRHPRRPWDVAGTDQPSPSACRLHADGEPRADRADGRDRDTRRPPSRSSHRSHRSLVEHLVRGGRRASPRLRGGRRAQDGVATSRSRRGDGRTRRRHSHAVLYADDLASGRLVQLFDLVADEDRGYWLAYRTTRRNSVAIRAFRDWVLGHFPAARTIETPSHPEGR